MIVVLAFSAMVGGVVAAVVAWQHGWLLGFLLAPVGGSLIAFAIAAVLLVAVEPRSLRTAARRSKEIPRGVVWC
jgi:uncharacterized membrane protein